MLVSTKSEELPEDALDTGPKKRELKAQNKTTLFKMKPKKHAFKHPDVLASPIMKQITGIRQKRVSPSPTKSDERNIIQTKFVKSRPKVFRQDL
jgi:hypothetical protein